VISQHWGWCEAWVYLFLYLTSYTVSRLLAFRKHADIIKERFHIMEHNDTQSWDNILVPLVGIGMSLIPIIAGLDALLGWSPEYHLFLKILALIILLAGYGLGSYAFVINRFFSGTVRLQTDRGHYVITGGPYQWIRHPGYAGGILTSLATPIFLDSPWIFLPAIMTTLVLVIRTGLEDRFLQNELKDYKEYMQKVRFRLIPGIW
jgi:protein-S-isoprenylcysteine O-methyltransferase Ste14